MVLKSYRYPESRREFMEDTWKFSNEKQKANLLKATGNSETFSKTKSVEELVNRGGGFAVRSIGRTTDEYLKRKGKVTINWV